MSNEFALPCIACEGQLKNVWEGADNQPYDGVVAFTVGNYGSRVFDDMEGNYLEFNVCDKCLKKAGEFGNVRLVTKTKSVSEWRN